MAGRYACRMRIWSCALPEVTEPTPRVWRVVEQIWGRIAENRSFAGPILSAAMREFRTLGSKERPVAGDILTGLMRHERALARLRDHPLAAWLQLCREGVPDLDDPENAYAIAVSLPDWIGAEWWTRLGSDAAIAHARIVAGRAPVTLRVLREPGEIAIPHHRVGHAIVLEERTNVHLLDAFRHGDVEVQDLGSQRIAEAAFPGVGGTVLDLCAGAGGKSLALAALGARVQAWDVRRDALVELDRRARRCRLDVHIGPPSGRYDVVLVDAPCSGTGVLRRHPENRWKLRFPIGEQRELYARAQTMAGRVVYATCALTRRENEEIAPGGETLWPEDGGRDGFYVATG